MMVLNEPETTLHPDLLPALQQDQGCNSIVLEKVLGETRIVGQGILDAPAWHWPE